MATVRPPTDAPESSATEGTKKQKPASPVGLAGRRDGFLQRVIPTSILGLASLLFFMAIASAFSGAVLFAYYQFEIAETQDRIGDVEGRVADDLDAAEQLLDEKTNQGLSQIDALLSELEAFAASGATLTDILDGVQESLFFVNTLDADGQPAVGTAWVLFSDSNESFLLTSYTTIRAATVEPAPSITVRKGVQEIPATLNGWDPDRDIALLRSPVPNLPPLPLADPSSVNIGDRIFAASGLGSAGGSITQGVVADVSLSAVQHDAAVGAHFQGGPLLNSAGEVVAISSRSYAPLAFDPLAVFFGLPWRQACESSIVLCPDRLTG